MVVKRRRATQRILNRSNDLVLVATKVKHVAVLIEYHKQHDAAAAGLHLTDQRTCAAIRTRDDDNMAGDSNYDLLLSDWAPAGTAKIVTFCSSALTVCTPPISTS